MNIIISPAKKMNVCNDDLLSDTVPPFMDKTEILYNHLSSMSYDELKKLLVCNDEIADLNFQRYKYMRLDSNLSPALLTYDGIQYKYMSPNTFSINDFRYARKHLKILSGFYGILTPFDGIVPYRLEMQAKMKSDEFKNLYDFWGDSIYKNLTSEDRTILNLASREYSKIVEKYITDDDTFITCIFGSLKEDKIKVKATEAKMARGLMVRYLCANNTEDINDVKDFSDMGFTFSEKHSNDSEFVFLR